MEARESYFTNPGAQKFVDGGDAFRTNKNNRDFQGSYNFMSSKPTHAPTYKRTNTA